MDKNTFIERFLASDKCDDKITLMIEACFDDDNIDNDYDNEYGWYLDPELAKPK